VIAASHRYSAIWCISRLLPSAIALATSEGEVAGYFTEVTVGGLADSAGFSSTHFHRFTASNAPDRMLWIRQDPPPPSLGCRRARVARQDFQHRPVPLLHDPSSTSTPGPFRCNRPIDRSQAPGTRKNRKPVRSVARQPELLSASYRNRVRNLSPGNQNQGVKHLPGQHSRDSTARLKVACSVAPASLAGQTPLAAPLGSLKSLGCEGSRSHEASHGIRSQAPPLPRSVTARRGSKRM
jgi:hypothetical protein